MRLDKRYILLLITTLFISMPVFGQRFTKKEQALREARAKNFFYGHSFTLSAGYVHSWLTTDKFDNNSASAGITGQFCNTRESFDALFSWDICTNRHWGVQFSAGYNQQGGQKLFYYEQNYGPQLRPDKTETIHLNNVEAQALARLFLPLTYKSRLSLNVGPYVNRVVGKYTNANEWDFGALVGLGYDWNHWSCNLTYKPGVFPNIIKGSDTRAASVSFNVGFRLWK